MAPYRVLWLTKGLGRGGSESLLVSSARHVDRRRFDVEVAYLLPWKDALVPALQGAGVPVHCLRQRHELDARWVAALRGLVRERRYDLVHTHMPALAAVTRASFPRRPPAIVHTEHNVWQRYRRATRLANSLTHARNDAVIAVSHAVAETVHPWPRRRDAGTGVRVVHHGIDGRPPTAVDRAARERARAALGMGDDDFVVGTVGNLTAKKDHAGLLHAFAALRGGVPHARLVVVGTGPLHGALTDLARELGVERAVLFTGSRDDVWQLLPGFDVFTLSSRAEGLSIALVEAMAAALPVVVTRVGGLPEVVSDGVEGLLVPPADPDALRAALAALAGDPERRGRMSEAAVRRSAHFDIRDAVRCIEAVYEEVLAS